MSLLPRLAHLIVAAASVTACATVTVGSHVERGVDFSQYRTYEWDSPDALPAGNARLEEDLLFVDRMQVAVEKALTARGYRRATFGVPDLLVHYHAAASARINVNHLDSAAGYCDGRPCGANVSGDDVATLVLDIIDARTDRLVWRGWAREDLDSLLDARGRAPRRINNAVERMLAQLPTGL